MLSSRFFRFGCCYRLSAVKVCAKYDSRTLALFRKESESFSRRNVQAFRCSTHNQTILVLEKFPYFEGINLGNLRSRFYSTTTSTTTPSGNEAKNLPSEEEHIKHLFPSPKNVLHNCFNLLNQDLQQPDLKLIPHFKQHQRKNKTGSDWTCTYYLKWPESIRFSSTAHSKREASHNAAVAALAWLKRNDKISKEGHPLIHSRQDVKSMIQKSTAVLKLEDVAREKLQVLVNKFDKDLVPLLDNISDENVDENQIEEQFHEDGKINNLLANNKQKFIGLHHYLVREPVVLPISSFKEEIEQAVENNRVVVIKGEPGCGKSTRVPQYVLESWAKNSEQDPCKIIVTQPRRIAAISLGERVANEREEYVGDTVGYQVRLQSKFNPNTGRILYCTTGILLRKLQLDPTLSECTHVILDEAHERDVNTDLLMNLLRYSLQRNPKLKLLVMSATIDAEVFQNYFENAAILHIPGFTYPVREHFLEDLDGIGLSATYNMALSNNANVICEDVVGLIKEIHKHKPEGAILVFLPGWEEITRVRKLLPSYNDAYVLCLHSRLQVSEQKRIFSRSPPGTRKIILSTNIAETSVTVDDVVYVIDTGIEKQQSFNVDQGVMCIDSKWISKSSMKQRKGRAGRCRAGESFHMYPRSKYESFAQFAVPEIQRMSLTKIVLDAKVYSNGMPAYEFLSHLLSPPDKTTIEKAVNELKELELFDSNENVTNLGKVLSDFQLPPKLSKAMVNSILFKCVTPVVDIVTLFAAESELFSSGLKDKEEVKRVKSRFCNSSDHLATMRLFENWLAYMEDEDFDRAARFCQEMGIVQHKLQTIRKLREIHFDYLYRGLNQVLPIADDFSNNDELVKAVLLSGVGNVLQHQNWDFAKGKIKQGNVFTTKYKKKATITPESVNFKKTSFPTKFVLYINETISNIRRINLVRETSQIQPLAVFLFKNNDLIIEEATVEHTPEDVKMEDGVFLKLKNTNLQLYCDRKDALAIIECKRVLRKAMEYFIYQLTKGANTNEDVNSKWHEILDKLSDVLEIQVRATTEKVKR